MPGLGFAPTSGRVAAKSTAPPPGPTSSSPSAASPFAVCYVSPKGNSNASANRNGFIGTTNNADNNDEKPKLDPSDPRVKKLVYSMYRDMLTSRNTEANDIISKKDPAKVTQDSGVGPILESIIIRQRGSQGGGDSPGGPVTDSLDSATDGGPTNGASTMAPPPPPPPMMPGAIPAVRLTSEIGPRDKGPPAALAGAMMKDKKPFTYTPGGIDLSEIRSPRMAKRIQMNAAAEGVTNTPTPSSNQERAPCQLPPAALAAMQPQMAFPVFPQGNMSTVQLNKMHKPADYAGPPPPPPQPMSAPIMRHPPPPPPAPLSPQPMYQALSPSIPQSPPPPRTPPPPPERAATPKSPLPPTDSYYGNFQPSSQTNNLEERRSPLGRKSPAVELASGVGTGTLFIPILQNTPQTQAQSPPPPPAAPKSPSPMSTYVPPSSRPSGQSKAQAVSQNIGSLYIPPIQGGQVQPSGAGSSSTNGKSNVSRTPQTAAQSQPTPPSASAVPATPQLNKAPIPWMNSYNRMQNQQADSPPYVHPGFFMPPWAPPPGVRTIPIMMGSELDQPDSSGGSAMTSPFQGGGTESRRSSSGSSTPSGSRTPSQAAAHLGRVIPIQIEREETGRSKGAKVIPIQIEGRPPRLQTPSTPTTPGMNPMRRAVGPPPYNSPMGLYSNQNAMDAYQRQAAEAAAGVDKMTVRCESPRTEPMQSKSLRMIQQAAENELKRIDQEQEQRRLDLSEDDQQLMNLFKAQVHEGSSLHQSAEPRFMGSHIPSRAFRALQTALPASPGAQDQPPPSYPAATTASGGPVTHHIPIRQAVSPTPPQSQQSEIQLSTQQQASVPPSEQKVQEPKKYMGSSIPSRSFKILQQMTADDGSGGGQPAVDSVDETALEQNITDSYNDDVDETYSRSSGENLFPPLPSQFYSLSQSSYPLSLSCSSEGGGSATFDPHANNCNNNSLNNDCSIKEAGGYDDGNSGWPNNQQQQQQQQQQGWDAYSYMWYYWWYYSSYYWAGYDMTGYDYPAGFDPNYCPPEFFSDYSAFSPYTTGEAGAELEKAYSEGERDVDAGGYYSESEMLNDATKRDRVPFSEVPMIVIEDGEGEGDRKKSNVGVDSIKDNDSCVSNNSKAVPSPCPSPPLTEWNKKPGILSTIPYKKNGCDKSMDAKDNDDHVDEASLSESDDEYESCCEDSEQKVIERETGPCNNNSKPFLSSQNFAGHLEESGERKFELNNSNYNSELNANYHGSSEQRSKLEGDCEDDEDEQEDEKTDPGTDEDNDDQDDYGGRVAIIEEPETASSADDSDATILGNGEEQRCGKPSYYESSGLSIEEYHSEESSESAIFDYGLGKNKLSTIDEITESRASSSLLSFNSCGSTATVKNSTAELNTSRKKNDGNSNSLHLQQNNGWGESEDSEESSDELSSVSVIENKSDATRGTTESKREDETTSTSEEEDSSTDDDDDDDKDDAKVGGHGVGGHDLYDEDEDGDGTDTAVTVRLPLKLCFTKTKSYRDITTVMVGDSEIEETSQVSMPSSSSSSSNEDEPKPVLQAEESENPERDNDDEEEEPVVSFTLSLSRQTSREDETKLRATINTACREKKGRGEDESEDIDFWAEIAKDEEENNNFKENSPVYESWEDEPVEGNEKSKEQKEDYEVKERVGDEADVGFWGVITRDGSASDFVRRRNKGKQGHEEENCPSDGWDLCESIEYKWEKDFNFWEKSSRTIETRRFSGNFEITEDYESDSGIKPSTEKKERVKKYTHHKRHSIPGPCGAWDSRSSLPPRPTPRQFTSSKSPHSGFNSNEQEIKEEEGKFDDGSSKYRKGKGVEEGKRRESLSSRQTSDTYQDDTDTSSWWSYWDEVSKQTEGEEKLEINEDDAFAATTTTTTTSTATTEKEMESGVVFRRKKSTQQREREESSTIVDDISVELKLSEAGGGLRTSTGESTGGEEDYQSFASSTGAQASRMEQRGSSGGGGLLERKNGDSSNERKSLNQSCQSDATDNEDYSSSSPEIKSSSLLFPSSCNQEEAVTTEKLNQQASSSISVSDENSDESSRSSGTTIGRHDKNEINHQQQNPTATSSDAKPDSESHLKGSKEGDEEEANTSPFSANEEPPIQIPVTIERNVEIQFESGNAAGDRMKLNGRQQYQEDHQHLHTVQHHHHHHHHTSTINAPSSSTSSTTTCTCLMGDRIARAENLLWRIERFLHESLSLGSEDDSGVMTDLSRQISDVDTDVDNDLNETEFLLTAATAVKERRGVAFATPPQNSTPEPPQHIESCNFGETISSTDSQPLPSAFTSSQQQSIPSPSSNTNNNSSPNTTQQVKRPRPKSDIFLESTMLSKVETEEIVQSTSVEENNGSGVRMRSASERRALRYQRAKTHSRLFQLLQDECGRDEEQDEFDYESDVGTLTSSCNHNNNNNSKSAGMSSSTNNVCQISVDTSISSATTGGIHQYQHQHHQAMDDDSNSNNNNESGAGSSPTRMNDAQARRSRLLPLPIKNLLASSLSLDSNSSPSGSSGVLSPTSPVNRDQLLADIINEFHLRNQASTMRAQSQRRMSSSFPSKIFKLLQHEFGEEFYQTFDCCGGSGGGGGGMMGEDSLISPSMSTNLCVNDPTSPFAGGAASSVVHECTIHKSESMKEFEEATNRILTNFMLRNTSSTSSMKARASAESPNSTATQISPQLLQDDSKNCCADLLEVPMRRKKGNLNRDPRSPKSTKKS